MQQMERAGLQPLPYPWQNAMTRPLRKAGSASGDAEVLSLWAGQGAAMAVEQSVQELVRTLEAGLRRSLATLVHEAVSLPRS